MLRYINTENSLYDHILMAFDIYRVERCPDWRKLRTYIIINNIFYVLTYLNVSKTP